MRRIPVFPLALIVACIVGSSITSCRGEDLNAVSLSRDAHFRELTENTNVRVWMMELRPDEKTSLISRDHDFLQIPLDEGWLSTAIEGKQAIPFWVEKKPRFVRGGFAQTVQNTSKAAIRVIEIEFIKSVGVERCGPEAQVSCGCWGTIGGIITSIGCRVLETDYVAISQLEVHPGVKVGLAVVPVLIAPIDTIQIQPITSSSDKGSVLPTGKVLWMDKAGQGIASSDEHATAKAVTIEFKSPAANLNPR
jgi:hypothetical protein